MMRSIRVELALAAFIMALIALSRLNMLHLYRRILGFAFLFGFLIALPSAFNVITRGEIVMPVATLSRSYHFWIYSIPKEIGITREGLFGVGMLTLRVMNSVSLTLLIMYTTPFFEIIRALKVFRVPDTFLMIIILSYKYIFIFSKTVEDMYRAMKAQAGGAREQRDDTRAPRGQDIFHIQEVADAVRGDLPRHARPRIFRRPNAGQLSVH